MSIQFHTPINNVSTTVRSMYTMGSHSLDVATGTGSLFGSTFPLIITASPSGSPPVIFEVTGRSTDTLTISSAIENTTDVNLAVGVTIEMRPTALAIKEVQFAILGGTPTNGQASLSSSYTITAFGSFQNTGLTVTIPSAGTYFLVYQTRFALQVTGGSYSGMNARLYDVGSSAVVANSTVQLWADNSGSGQVWQFQSAYNVVATFTGTTTVRLEAQAYNFGSPATLNLAEITSDPNGQTTLTYIKLSN